LSNEYKGTDGLDNFGDLWVFRGSESILRWERLVAVGLPPCPRYGHQMVLLNSCDIDGYYGKQNLKIKSVLLVHIIIGRMLKTYLFCFKVLRK
jgi:hypothetical protein